MAFLARRRYALLAWLALLWAAGNAVYVYLVLGGHRVYRVESAAFLLVAVLLPLVFWPRPAAACESVLRVRDSRLLMLAASGLWFATLAPSLTTPFLADDYVFLASYRQWSDVLSVRQFFRPLFALVFFGLSRLGDGSVMPFHVAALCLHAAAACCVYVLTRRLFERTDVAALCCSVFLLNPLQLEAVLWASGLQELLWTTFVLTALVAYTGARFLSPSRVIVTLVFMACGLLSKETAICAVLLLPASDWMFYRMERGTWLPAAYIGMIGVAAAYLVVRGQATSVESAFFVAPERYFVQKFVATPYKFFVQPWNVTAGSIPALVVCATAVAALVVVTWAVVRGIGWTALVGPAVIFISTLPVYAYFYVAPDLRASRYLYFAAVGWAMLVAQLLTTIVTRRLTLAAAAAGLMALLFASLQLNSRPWGTAGAIVHGIASAIRDGRSPEMSAAEWRAKYGEALEVKDGIPTVYRGVYLFVNGYPELRELISRERASR